MIVITVQSNEETTIVNVEYDINKIITINEAALQKTIVI